MKKLTTLLDPENVFDQAEALHTVLTLYHAGQWTKKYELLCRSSFKPGPLWSEQRVMEENFFFDELEQYDDEQLEQLMNEIENHLENEGEN